MADKRAFAKFDVGYLDNPKMMDVLDSSLHAICMHFASVLYCSQHLTDGIVSPAAMARKVGASTADIEILLEAGLWHGPGHDCESCWNACPEVPENRVYVHDFLEHNRDAAEAKRVSKKRSEAAKSRWNKDETADANVMQSALQKEDVCNAEREREKERKKTLSPTAIAAEFDQWYSDYPKKEGKEAARKAFAKARKSAELQELIDGLARYKKAAQGTERRFIPNPATWLNAGRWQDDYSQDAGQQTGVPAAYGWFN